MLNTSLMQTGFAYLLWSQKFNILNHHNYDDGFTMCISFDSYSGRINEGIL